MDTPRPRSPAAARDYVFGPGDRDQRAEPALPKGWSPVFEPGPGMCQPPTVWSRLWVSIDRQTWCRYSGNMQGLEAYRYAQWRPDDVPADCEAPAPTPARRPCEGCKGFVEETRPNGRLCLTCSVRKVRRAQAQATERLAQMQASPNLANAPARPQRATVAACPTHSRNGVVLTMADDNILAMCAVCATELAVSAPGESWPDEAETARRARADAMDQLVAARAEIACLTEELAEYKKANREFFRANRMLEAKLALARGNAKDKQAGEPWVPGITDEDLLPDV